MKIRELRKAEKYFDETGMPMVRTTKDHLIPWNRKFITNSLIRETKLAKEFHNTKPISKEEAERIAIETENRIKEMKLKFVSGPLVREIVNIVLLEKSAKKPEYIIYRNIMTRVGMPVYDAYEIDRGEGFEARENANLQPNSETVHKKKADKMSKEQYLLLMPTKVADAHLSGDFHIHDLEYFGTRPFCQSWDLRYFLYFGFLPDGLGYRTSVAGPAKHAEVAVLHSTKVLAAAQTNFAGGEGFYNYLVFLAPFVRGLEYKKVKQLMQLMFFELTQMYVARGGQPVFSNVQITPGVPQLWRNVPVVARGKVGPDVYGDYEDEVRTLYRAINEVAMEGDYWGKPFNFPKLENGISPEFFNKDYDEEWLLAHKLVAKFGIPYFDNMIPEYRGYGKGVSCYQCLPADELIITQDNGDIKIKEIQSLTKNDEVLSFSPNPSVAHFSKPEGIFTKYYNGKLFNIQLRSGRRIRVTNDHPITIKRDDKLEIVLAKEIKINDEIPVITSFPRNVIDKINVDEKIIETRALKKIPKSIPITNEFAELLGLYIAEGDSEKIPRGAMVRFSFGKHEEELVERVIKLVKNVFDLDAHRYVFDTAIVVQIGNIQLYKFITEQLKMGSNSYKKDIPDIVFQFKKEQIWKFIKAVFAGDAGLSVGRNQYGSKTYSLQLRLSSKKAVQKIALLSNLIKLPLNYYEHKYGEGDKKIYVCRLTSKKAIEHFEEERSLIESDVIYLKVRKIIEENYNGLVFDPVNLKGNHFPNGLGVVTHNCCAYSFVETPETDPEFHAKLNFEDGKHFSMGSWQVVTLNLPRAAYRAGGDDERLIDELKRLMESSVIVFKSKKHWMDLMLKNNRIPFAQQGPRDPRTGKKGPPPVDFKELVWVIGMAGANEMVQHHTGYQLHESDEAVKLALRVVLEMRKYLKELERKHGMRLSLARTPAESSAQRLAICDMLHPDFRKFAEETVKGDLAAARKAFNNGGGGDVPIYYSNGTHVYVGAQTPLLDRMKIESKFFPALGGGNMFHVWLGENNPSVESLFEFTKKIATQSQIGYFAYTKDLTICQDCNVVSSGVFKKCPGCNSDKVKWWSRVTGYYQDVKSWNKAKQREFEDRYRVKI